MALVIAVVACAASCRRPGADETFIRADGSGRYEFTLDMADSLCTYDLSFYTRVDSEVDDIPLSITWYSPDGERFTENVHFHCAESQVAPYRLDCDPSPHGQWRLVVRAEVPGMRGLGLVCARKQRDGRK